MPADLVLVGRVLTGDPRRPHADALAVRGDRIAALGGEAEVRSAASRDTRVLGGRSCAIVPGFVDAHIHFVALARRAGDVDCSREHASSISEISSRIGEAARDLPEGTWIRAFGYDESFLADRRAPTPTELDRAAPAHPVRLLHRTGHAAVLNGVAFRRLGLAARDVIFEPGEVLQGKLRKPEPAEMTRLAACASERLLASGITTFHDVTPGQSAMAIGTLRSWTRDRTVRQRVAAYGDPQDFALAGDQDDRFVAPGVKILVTEASAADDVVRRVEAADAAGAQVAIHAVEGGPLTVAIAALESLGRECVRARRHRIEHASLCPPPLRKQLAATGASIVTHPSFLTRFGRKYRSELTPEEREWLYPLRGFRELGVPLALGSDAPIAPSEPLMNIQAAVVREDEDGETLGVDQRVSAAEALAMHTLGGVALLGWNDRLGILEPGRFADAVLLDADPTTIAPRDIGSIRVLATIVGGEVAWSR